MECVKEKEEGGERENKSIQANTSAIYSLYNCEDLLVLFFSLINEIPIIYIVKRKFMF